MKEFLKIDCKCLRASLLTFISISVLAGNSSAYFADTLFNNGDYGTAMLEYKRLNLFYPAPALAGQVNHFKYQIGKCYEKTGDYENAVKYYQEAGANKDLIRIYLRLEDYSSASFICEDLNDSKITGWVYLMESSYDEASKCFEESGDKEIQQAAIKCKTLPYKSITTAELISVLIPGSGEAYAGNWKSGLVTLLLNGITGGLAVKSFVDHRYLDGTLITCLFWNRFYNGGIMNAGVSASKYNELLKQRYLNSIKDYAPDFMEASE